MYSAMREHKTRKNLASNQFTNWIEASVVDIKHTTRIITAIILVIIR